MPSSASRRCKNCKHWLTMGSFRQRGEGDCLNPKVGQLVRCLSNAHFEHPELYPHMGDATDIQFRTYAEFGCVLFEGS